MVIRGQLFHYRWTSRWPIKSGDLKIHIGTKMLKTFMKTPEKAFTYLLDKVWVGNINDDVKLLLKTRFIHLSDKAYS